eukprot:4661099-Prymnesium_polylepis.1
MVDPQVKFDSCPPPPSCRFAHRLTERPPNPLSAAWSQCEQEQANKWVKNMEKENGLKLITLKQVRQLACGALQQRPGTGSAPARTRIRPKCRCAHLAT